MNQNYKKELDYSRIEFLTEGKILDLLKKYTSELAGNINRIIFKKEPMKKSAPFKVKSDLELEYDLLQGNPNVKKFLDEYNPNFLKSEKNVINNLKKFLDHFKTGLDALKEASILKDKEIKYILDRYTPFFKYNKNLALVDKQNKNVVWFLWNSKDVIVDLEMKPYNYLEGKNNAKNSDAR